MGGSAGHIEHLYEDYNLTFNDLREVMQLATNNQLENVTEKLDGQNLMVTFRNGIIVASRTTRHLKNFGEEALTIPEMKDYFNERKYPFMGDIYCDAMKDLEQAIIPYINVNKEFMNGQMWINLEILCQESENVIHYGKDQLRIHNVKHLDENGKTLTTFEPYFVSEIKKQQKRFHIDRTNTVNLNPVNLSGYLKELDLLLSKLFGNKIDYWDKTLGDYLKTQYILGFKSGIYLFNKRVSLDGSANIDYDLLIEQLSDRWVYGIKNPPINKLKKGLSPKLISWITNMDEQHKINNNHILKEIYLIISKWGIELLNNIDDLATSDPYTCKVFIEEKLRDCDFSNFPGIPSKIGLEINLFKSLGKYNSIAPTEGIVFTYKNKTYKITGGFIPILRIIGYYKFRNESEK